MQSEVGGVRFPPPPLATHDPDPTVGPGPRGVVHLHRMDGDLVPEPLELLGDRMSVIRARPSVAHDQCGLDWAMVPIEEDAAGTLSYSFRPKNPCRSGAFE